MVIGFIVLLVLTIMLTAMSAAYKTLSTAHLRHWAKAGDAAAKKLYPLKARGSATFIMIELMRACSLAGVVVIIARSLPLAAAWLVIAFLMLSAFIILTQLFLKPVGMYMLVWLSAPLLALTHLLKPLTLPLGRVFDRSLNDEPVTLTRADLAETINSVAPEDTDLSPEELRIIGKALHFSSQKVHDIMTPKRRVVSVKASDTLSPIILDELHQSGHSRFPVTEEDGKTIVGILHMHDLADVKHHTQVAEAMQPKVYFVEEDRSLSFVLETFYKTGQPVYVVLNAASEMVGLISVEDVVEQVMGKQAAEETEEAVAPVVPIDENEQTVVK